MKKETNTGNDAPFMIPMHIKFEENLIISEVTGKMPETHMPAIDWIIKKRILGGYLREYYSIHNNLPDGCHDIGKFKNYHSSKLVVDFDAIRQKIHDDLKHKDCLNLRAWNEGGVISNFQVQREIMVGISEQFGGRNPNELIFNMRQRIENRERYFT